VLVGGLAEGVLGEVDLDEGQGDEHMIKRAEEEQIEQLRSENEDLRAEVERLNVVKHPTKMTAPGGGAARVQV
jgi:hypothetical protein